jgi:proteasome lid subunit RPN8/RPN11
VESSSIRVQAGVLAAIDAHARAEAPRECCGLLLGTANDLERTIQRAESTRNLASTSTRYDIDPADHFRILREARRSGLTILGAYHSHPQSVPIPSPTDLAEGWPNFLYVITTLLNIEPRLRGYYLEGAAYREVRLVTID